MFIGFLAGNLRFIVDTGLASYARLDDGQIEDCEHCEGACVTANASTSCGSLLRRGDIARDLSSFSSSAFTCHPVEFTVFDLCSMIAVLSPKIMRP